MFHASENVKKQYKVGKMEEYKSLKVSKETHKTLKLLSTETDESIISVTEKAIKLGIEQIKKAHDPASQPSKPDRSE